ncbi:type IV pili methyl-accepting chemotaxis transducer N-terminal domain-containing protein [Maribacter sp. X9]|uniref:type IV pili methyl-accepting chemotaxis transducer N-terminal domain-containing protein n=1 Tax=Maribacter sp. X9 TaxID=3402159 RepID=UPI003AF391FF
MKTKKRSFKDFYKYYLLVFTVILLTVIIQSVIQYSLKEQEGYSSLINISGKQRMLSQKVLANFYECRFLEGNYTALKLALDNLYETHIDLQKGNLDIGIEPIADQEVQSLFNELNQHLDYIYSNLNDVDKLKEVSSSELSTEVASFLTLMDAIVNRFQELAEEEIRTLMIIEMELAFATIVIVLLEVFFIVNPVIKKITLQNKKLKEISWYQTHAVTSHIKNIKELQHVLKLERKMEFKEELIGCLMEELDDLEGISKDMVQTLESTTT